MFKKIILGIVRDVLVGADTSPSASWLRHDAAGSLSGAERSTTSIGAGPRPGACSAGE